MKMVDLNLKMIFIGQTKVKMSFRLETMANRTRANRTITINSNITTEFSFIETDGFILSTQILLVLFTFIIMFFSFLCRKRKELKHRGLLPYIFNVGMCFYSVQTMISLWTFLKIFRKRSLTFG
jgi:hypothetical protein